ncbi:MAG: hypothetical protein WAN10_16880 [Candidatus Acidiferrales bacterium]
MHLGRRALLKSSGLTLLGSCLLDPESGCGFNWSDTVVTAVKSAYRMSRAPYSKEWCWIKL